MSYRDLVKQAATVAGTNPFVFGGAVQGFQTMNAGRAIGEKVRYKFTLGADWEVGIGTIAANSTLLRLPSASSNGGALVNFASGTGELSEAVTAAAFNEGMTDPLDPGFDIVLCAGQSNMVGLGPKDANIDIVDPRVHQFSAYAGNAATYQKITTAADPLWFPFEANGVAPGIGPASWFSKTYAGMIPSNRRVLLVPVAQGGMSLVYAGGSPVKWAPGSPGGVLYEMAITQANAALAAALAMYPNSRFVGTIWLQGESDGDWTISTSVYAAALKNLIAGFRSRITGAANSWFVIAGMVPEGIVHGNHAGFPAIDAAHKQVATESARCAFVAGPAGCVNEVPGQTPLHYNGQGARILGCGLAAAVPFAKRSVGVPDIIAPVTQGNAAVANGAPTVVAITMSEFLDSAFVPAAAAFTVGGHAVSSVAISGAVINLTCATPFVNGEAARTVAYVQPGANAARDVAGNLLGSFSNLAISNNVAAVDGLAPAFSSAQVTNSQPAVILVTMNETLAASIPPNGAFTPSGGRTVTGVTISGAVASVTVNTPYASTDTITIAYTQPGANPRLQDAAGNATATFAAQTVTNGVAAAGGGNGTGGLRFADLVTMTETSATPPYAYRGAGASYNGNVNNGATSVMAMAGDGSVTIQIGDNTGKPMLGLKTQSTTVGYSSIDCIVFADPAGYARIGTSGGVGGATGIIPAAGDLMRMSRTGTTVVAAVSKDGGTTWTTINTWNNAPAGARYAQILCEANGTLVGPVGVGFA